METASVEEKKNREKIVRQLDDIRRLSEAHFNPVSVSVRQTMLPEHAKS